MRIFRYIMIVVLLADLGLFVFYHHLMRASHWSLKKPVIVFECVTLVLVFLQALYDIFTIKTHRFFSEQKWILPLMVMGFLLLVKTNPWRWPLGHDIYLKGNWKSKMTSGNLEMYESGLFTINWNGFARDGLYQGRYHKQKDTVYLDYDGYVLDRVGKKLHLRNDTLFPVDAYDDVFLRSVAFSITQKHE